MSDPTINADDWLLVGDDDPLFDPPDEAPPYVADPLIDSLPYRQLSWETFEKLLVRVAHKVDRLTGVRRYGAPGQRQHGIDVVGWTASGDAHVLQGKNVQEFEEDDLARAIEKFRQGKRPFTPTRLILGVAVPARRTKVVEGIETAAELLNMDVELYDADRLDELLRNHPLIVEEFFGGSAASRFCTTTNSASRVTAFDVDPTVRAFATGPIRALGLQDEEKAALELEDPVDRARALQAMAVKLSASGWEPNARALRQQAGRLLVTAIGQSSTPDLANELATLSLREAVSALLVGDASAAGSSSRTLAGLVGIQPMAMGLSGGASVDLPDFERWRARADALLAATDALREPYPWVSGALARFRNLVESLVLNDDSTAPKLAVTLGELLLAAAAEPMSDAVLDGLRGAADTLLGGNEHERPLGARLACVVAEMQADWGTIVERVRRSELDPWGAALVMARYARWNALAGRMGDAQSGWREATRWAGEAKLSADAASWMRCLIQIRMRGAAFDPGVQDLAATAATLAGRPSGERLTPDVDGEWREALGALAEVPPDIRAALEPLVRVRWAYAVSGDLRQELMAVSRIGDVLRIAGEQDAALDLYVRASATDEAQALVSASGDTVLHATDLLGRPLQDQRATVYVSVNEGGDLIPDDEVEAIGSAALADVVGVLDGTISDSPFAPNLLRTAVDALAALADRLSEDVLVEAARALKPSMDRPEDRYAWTDEGLFTLLARTAARQDFGLSVREEAARSLAGAALVMSHVRGNPNELIRLRDEQADLRGAIEDVLLPAAADGRRVALLILSDHPLVRRFVTSAAADALERVCSLPASKPGEVGFGVSYGEDVWLIRTLDEEARLAAIQGLIARASRTDDVLANRESALSAIPSLTLTLDVGTRETLFEQLMEFGRGLHDEVTVGLELGRQHPLSSFQFDIGPSSIIPAGLRTASSCAMTESSQTEVADRAIAELRSRGIGEFHNLVTALATLPAAILEGHLPLLVRDDREGLRALAAVGWTQAPIEQAIGDVLADDLSAQVRRTLATNLHAVASTAEANDQRWPAWSLALEHLSSDSRASIRHLARSALARAPQ